MAGKTFLKKFTDALLDRDDEEESIEEMDKRLEREIKAVMDKEEETLEGSTMLEDGSGLEGDLAFIVNLNPLYKITGGRDSMLGKRLPDVCENIFGRLVGPSEGTARMKGDFFVMNFTDPSPEFGFQKSAEVINGIGLQTIGERFMTIEIPGLLAAVNPADLKDEDGNFDPSKAKEQSETGGSGVVLVEPGPDEPVWFKLSVKKANAAAELVKAPGGEKPAGDGDGKRPRRRGDTDWADQRTDRRQRISFDPMQMERRSGRDRRAK